MIMSGSRSAMVSRASSRHSAHSVYSRSRLPLYSLTSGMEHPDLVSTSIRQPEASASWLSGGNHWAAWESPNRTRSFSPSGSPNQQWSLTSVLSWPVKQPSA